MRNHVEIKVTQRHIDDAQRYANKGFTRCSYCPVALAAQAAGLRQATASARGICYLNDAGETAWTEPLPPVAEDFIVAFDANKPVDPFGFVVAFRENDE